MEPPRHQDTRNRNEKESSLRVRGLGLVTPLDEVGRNTFEAMRAGGELVDQGIVDEKVVAGLAGVCGAVPGGVAEILGDKRWDKSVRLGCLAALQAVKRAGWTHGELSDAGTGLFVGTSKGPMLATMGAYQELLGGGSLDEITARQVALGPGTLGTVLAERLGVRGVVHTAVAACSSGMHALHGAGRALRRGECERALVVAADASVHELFEASFARLGVLAKPDADGHRRCRPFGEGRGFIISEGAAAVALEREDGHQASGIILDETWIGGDGTSLIAGDVAGESLRAGLRQMREWFGESPWGFIHAHATGTGHDAYEWEAIRSVFPEAMLEPENGTGPAVFSHKGFIGHTLGAAGLIGVVLSAMCHGTGKTLTGRPLDKEGRSLTLSQGFGGHIGMSVLRGA